jgi:hypothetical protein
MKHFSLIMILSLVFVGSMNAGQPPRSRTFIPGLAMVLQNIRRGAGVCAKGVYRCMPSKEAKLLIPIGLILRSCGDRYGQKAVAETSGSLLTKLNVINGPYVRNCLTGLRAVEQAQALTPEQKEQGRLEHSALPNAIGRFASCLAQEIVYTKALVQLASKLSVCQDAQQFINRACDYSWPALVGVTVAEQLAMMTAKNMCKQYMLKPFFDWMFGKIGL